MARKTNKTYVLKYEQEHYDKILVRIPKGTREVWKRFAGFEGISLNQFIVKCVNEAISRGDDGK